MKIVFAGTPEFAAVALQSVLKTSQHHVDLVLTQPDRPAGRGMKLQPSAVKKIAVENNLEVLQPISLRFDGKYPDQAKSTYEKIMSIQPDLMIVVAYGLILPKAFLDIPRLGCINIHASLLPRWRGAAPIQRAIEAGDMQSGVCIMRMEEGLDTGPVLLKQAISITEDDTAGSLHDKLALVGADLLSKALEIIGTDQATFTAQDDTQSIYAQKIRKEEGLLDFNLPAKQLSEKIRAFNPFPGCVATFGDVSLKIWSAQALKQQSNEKPGTVVNVSAEGVDVACGSGTIRLLQIQKPGAKRLPATEFIKGFSFENGRFS